MESNIILFLIYALIGALIIRFVPNKLKNIILFTESIVFYTLCDYKFVILLLLQIILSYFISKKIRENKFMLVLGLFVCSCSLLSLKIYSFVLLFADSATSILIPLGISYYTFKMISFLVLSYKGKLEKEYGFIVYANYISFFPQIICGPIAAADDFLTQLDNWQENITVKLDSNDYIYRIFLGLFMKIVIANRLSTYVGKVFANYTTYPTLSLWMGAVFFAFVLYCDFAGYSEIAIGVAGLMNIKTRENFNLPFFSYSINDFWKRWHISLSEWLRNYIYIPLGGSRKGKIRSKINILIVFLVCGFWHGNGVNYLLWGLYYGLLSMFRVEKAKNKILSILQVVHTFFLFLFGLIIFKSNTVKDAFLYIFYMFRGLFNGFLSSQNIINSVLPFTDDNSCVAYLLTATLMMIILMIIEFRKFINKEIPRKAVIYICFICIILFGVFGKGNFLYANY